MSVVSIIGMVWGLMGQSDAEFHCGSQGGGEGVSSISQKPRMRIGVAPNAHSAMKFNHSRAAKRMQKVINLHLLDLSDV